MGESKSELTIKVSGDENIIDTQNRNETIVTLSTETFEQLAAKYGYTKADPLKVEISHGTARKLAAVAKNHHCIASDVDFVLWDDAGVRRAYEEVTEAIAFVSGKIATALEAYNGPKD
jgi:cupin superfamily acireductone dioxygenase involved in methionine salvage